MGHRVEKGPNRKNLLWNRITLSLFVRTNIDVGSDRLREIRQHRCTLQEARLPCKSTTFAHYDPGHLVTVLVTKKSRRPGPKTSGPGCDRRPAPDPSESPVYNTGASNVRSCASRH